MRSALAGQQGESRVGSILAQFLPETLHHDDLSHNNIMFAGSAISFIDWTECAVTHPFMSLEIPLRVSRFLFGADPAACERLRASYLQPWAEHTRRDDLGAFVDPAMRLASVVRANTWHRMANVTQDAFRLEALDNAGWRLKLFLAWPNEPD